MADKVRGHERLRCFLYLFPRLCFPEAGFLCAMSPCRSSLACAALSVEIFMSWLLLLLVLLLLLGKNCNCATLAGSVQSRLSISVLDSLYFPPHFFRYMSLCVRL